MSKSRKERCPQCGSLNVIKWGKRGNHQRFKCKNCDSMFTFRRKDVSVFNSLNSTFLFVIIRIIYSFHEGLAVVNLVS